MKCATTSLFSYLAEHPAIAPSSVKEPEFFSEHQGHVARAARYRISGTSTPPAYAMEASTGYTKWPGRAGGDRRLLSPGMAHLAASKASTSPSGASPPRRWRRLCRQVAEGDYSSLRAQIESSLVRASNFAAASLRSL